MSLMLEHSKTIAKTLILPPGGPLLLAIIGALLLRWRPRLGGGLLALGLVSLWLLSIPLIAFDLTRAAQHYDALDLAKPTGAAAIVILGGGGYRPYAPEYAGPAASPYLLDRLAYGSYVARKTGLPILVTGYHLEASAMRASLQRNFGIEPRWVDNQSYDTFDNAHNSAQILHAAGVRRIILVTDTTHLWRAGQEFTAAGLSVVPAPLRVVTRSARGPNDELTSLSYLPDPQALERSYEALYELIGEPVRGFLAATHLRRQ